MSGIAWSLWQKITKCQECSSKTKILWKILECLKCRSKILILWEIIKMSRMSLTNLQIFWKMSECRRFAEIRDASAEIASNDINRSRIHAQIRDAGAEGGWTWHSSPFLCCLKIRNEFIKRKVSFTFNATSRSNLNYYRFLQFVSRKSGVSSIRICRFVNVSFWTFQLNFISALKFENDRIARTLVSISIRPSKCDFTTIFRQSKSKIGIRLRKSRPREQI